MIKSLLLIATAAATLALVAPAQSCSDLSVSGSLTSGGSVDFDVTGAPADSITVIFVGLEAGATSLGFGLQLGIAAPFAPAAIGAADMNGDFSASIAIPNVPAGTLDGIDLVAQALSIDIGGIGGPPVGGPGSLPFSFCTSDVEAFSLTF